MAYREVPEEHYCMVCGHPIAHYMTICDKCGSIQRHSKGDGIDIPPEKLGICEVCGEKAPEGETLCVKCFAKTVPSATVKKIPRSRRLKVASLLFAVSGLLFLVAMLGTIFGPGGTVLIITFAVLSASFLGISIGVFLRAISPMDKIEVYPHVTQKEKQNF
ncbi:MAG: TraR/DksA C4-type zinc finger protein [Actinobacteria bacterium]|nr:TraR/DksA C4-type zinc finger protein [Actinomycetota bacterium]